MPVVAGGSSIDGGTLPGGVFWATWGVNPRARPSATKSLVSYPLSPATVRRRRVGGSLASMAHAVERSV